MKFWKIARWSNGEPVATPAKSVREVCMVVEGRHSCDGSAHTPLLPVSGDGEREATVVPKIRHNLSKMCYDSEAHIS